MGVSTNAILFYGYCWDDEIDLFDPDGESDDELNDSEWVDVVARKRGHKSPWDSYPEAECDAAPYGKERNAIGDKWMAENRAAIDAWAHLKKSIEQELGCEINHHCSQDCMIPYIEIADSGLFARRGYPARIDAWPKAGDDWDGKLEKFCKELGIEPPPGQKPGWWLVSYWG
jgi:hypothetical protein